MTAIRETFEETGLLLATSPSGPPPSDTVLDAARESIHTGKTLFRDFLRRHGLIADVKALLPFTEWVTPLGAPTSVRALFVSSMPISHAPHSRAYTDASIHGSTSPFCLSSARPASPLAPRSTACPPRTAGKKSSRCGSYIYKTPLQNISQRK